MTMFQISISPPKGLTLPIYNLIGHFLLIEGRRVDLSGLRKRGQCGKAEERQKIFSQSNPEKQLGLEVRTRS